MSASIAIIGVAGRFPGAPDLAAYWRNLRDGRECVSFFRDDEIEAPWRAACANPRFIKAAAILDDIDLFDAAFFSMSAEEAALTDPQHRLFLESAWMALEDAGYGDPDRIGRPVSVFGGSWTSSYARRSRCQNRTTLDEFRVWSMTGIDYLTTFTSYKLNLTGESVAVQTVCSTSLVAVHQACQSLITGSSDLAIAGGAAIDPYQRVGHFLEDEGLFSPDGHTRSFDAGANGTIRGHGVGVVLLKRLDDALADGDHVYAVIRATAATNDGRNKVAFTAPSLVGQSSAAALALAYAGVEPETVQYLELHGGGTLLGDAIEVEAMTRAYETAARQFCGVGSVKTVFGDLIQASGIAALLKVVLSLQHRQLPPSLHYHQPNPRIDFGATPFYVNDSLKPWPEGSPRRRAAVAGAGLGGTNVHVVLEEPPASLRAAEAGDRPLLFTVSALTPAALARVCERLRAALITHLEYPLADVAFTLNVGRKALPCRAAVVARTRAELLSALEQLRPLGPHGSPGLPARAGELAARATSDSPADDLRALADAWTAGHDVDWTRFYGREQRRRLSLPTYPFERQRHWLEAGDAPNPNGFVPWLGQVR